MFNIRPYQLHDLESTVQLWYRTWHQAFPIQHPQAYSEWLTRFRDDLEARGDIWVAQMQNCIVGFIVVIVRERELNQLFKEWFDFKDFKFEGFLNPIA